MIPSNPSLEFLYSFENPAEYAQSCAHIFAKYAPQGEMETQLVSHIAVAVWLRRRYAITMHAVMRQLEEARETGASETLVSGLTRSLVRFNREYRQQKRHISGCRGTLKRLRLQAASGSAEVIPFPVAKQEDHGYDTRYADAA